MDSAEQASRRYLEDLERSVRPTEEEECAARRISSELSDLLQDRLEIEQVELVGSIRRNTHLSPIDDLDLVCVFDGAPEELRHQYLQHTIIQELQASGLMTEIHTGDAVVLCTWHDGHHKIDIVPLVRTQDEVPVLRRPATSGEKLIPHDPWRQAQLAEEKDQETNSLYRPAVRLLKLWNRNHQKPIPRSYLLEVFTWYGLNEASDYPSVMSETLDYAYQALKENFLADPGNPDDNVFGGLSDEARRGIRLKVDQTRRTVDGLLEQQDNGVEEWRRLFRLS